MSEGRLVVPARFRGPPGSANGGYFAGLLAAELGGEARVRLSSPPPLDTQLRLVLDGEALGAWAGDRFVAEARPARLDLPVPPPPDPTAAEDAATRFPGLQSHPFPGCFVCGTEREVGDGLRIFAGSLSGRDDQVAAPWIPHGSLGDEQGRARPEFLWAALDCPGAFTFARPPATVALLGEVTASVSGALKCREPATVLGWLIASDGRKRTVGSALFDAHGSCVARARSTWILVPEQK